MNSNHSLNCTHFKLFFYLYTLLIVLASVLPINNTGDSINHIFVISIRLDYLLHCIIFIPWVILWSLYVPFSFTGIKVKLIMIGFVFALANEAIQYFLPYRTFNINDIIANELGVIFGFILVFFNIFRNICPQ